MSLGIEGSSHLRCIYTSKHQSLSEFKVIGAKQGGSSVGSLFVKERTILPSQASSTWLGKIGAPNQLLSHGIKTIETILQELNLSSIGEKIASDCYKELSSHDFIVPTTRLSLQPIIDPFTKIHPSMQKLLDSFSDVVEQEETLQKEAATSLRLMSKFVEGYVSLDQTYALDCATYQPLLFCDYIKKYHCTPTEVVCPEGVTVPLLGMMELLAVGRLLADPDILGGNGTNAGIVWVRDDEQRITHANVVKVDAGASFMLHIPCVPLINRNWVIDTMHPSEASVVLLQDCRDLQVSTWNFDMLIRWDTLSMEQKKAFIRKLIVAKTYLEKPDVLALLLYREGMFNRGRLEVLPHDIYIQYKRALVSWMNLQHQIYKEDIDSEHE